MTPEEELEDGEAQELCKSFPQRPFEHVTSQRGQYLLPGGSWRKPFHSLYLDFYGFRGVPQTTWGVLESRTVSVLSVKVLVLSVTHQLVF